LLFILDLRGKLRTGKYGFTAMIATDLAHRFGFILIVRIILMTLLNEAALRQKR